MKKTWGKLNKFFIPGINNNFKPQIFESKNLFRLAIILLVIKFLVFSWFFYFPQTSDFAIVTSSELIEMTNRDRIAAGLKPLIINQKLVEAAKNKAQDMLNNNYFAHFSSLGTSPWYWIEKAGYKYTAAGENLAKDFTDSIYVQKAWMSSSSHRKNILNANYRDIGIAVVEGEINGETTVLAVQIFGKPATSTAKPVSSAPVASAAEPAKTTIETETNISTEPLGAESNIESESDIESKEIVSLKEPSVFKQRGFLGGIMERINNVITQKVYLTIAGIISVILILTIFIKIEVQYPRTIFTVIIFVILIAAIALFNDKEILNRGLDII